MAKDGVESTTETVVVVRQIKVIGMLLGGFSLLLMTLSVAATAWIQANSVREGLWERCFYRPHEEDMVDCHHTPRRQWLVACQGLFLLAMALTLAGVVAISVGLKGDSPPRKFRAYMVGVGLFLAAVAVQVVALIIFPVKFLEEMPDRSDAQWHFGWSYGLSWAAGILISVGAVLVFIDRGAEEVLEKEVVVRKEGLEEEEPL